MNRILVAGGTGRLGRDLVARLLAERRSVRLLARTPGKSSDVEWARGDLATGDGIAEAVRDVDTVIHAATLSPIASRGGVRPIDFFTSPSTVDIDGTRRLLEASARAGVKHFLFVSIVGLEGSPLPYSRVKLAGEQLVRESSVPWSVVRATPFYYLTAQMLAGLRWLPIWPVPDVRCNPVDTTDVAEYLVECLDDGKRGMREEIGGPETASFVEFARQYQAARGWHRPIWRMRPSPERARQMGFVEATDRRGRKTWSDWLREGHLSEPDRNVPATNAGRRPGRPVDFGSGSDGSLRARGQR
jgi:uncharacterized protein YbjT (DUF2867 family)